MRYLLIFISVTLSFLLAKTFIPHLSKNEKLFKKSTLYKLKDFNLNLDISFLSVVSFITISREKKELKYKELQTIFKSDNRVYSQKNKSDILYLANLMKKRKNYPLKVAYGPWGDRYFIIIFIDQKGKMFALEDLKELKDMLGDIDTPAEILLWIRVKNYGFPYSYLFTNNLWRLRFKGWDLGRCNYSEYFKFYNKKGHFIQEKLLRKYHKKGCVEVVE